MSFGVVGVRPRESNGAARLFRVRNWEKFQHYKQRNPPWIKLHSEILENPDYASLPDVAKAHVNGIWVLAARLGNRLPWNPDFIGKRINATEPVDLDTLMRAGFIEPLVDGKQSASATLAACLTRGETEESRGETEESRTEEREKGAGAPASPLQANDHGPQVCHPSPSEESSIVAEPERAGPLSRKTSKPRWSPTTQEAAEGLIEFYNRVWESRVGATPGNVATVAEALEAGYTEAQLRAAVFASRYATEWFAKHKRDLSVVLRFKCPKGEVRILDGLIQQAAELDCRPGRKARAAAEALEALVDLQGLGARVDGQEPKAARGTPPPMSSEQRAVLENALRSVDEATRLPQAGEAHRQEGGTNGRRTT